MEDCPPIKPQSADIAQLAATPTSLPTSFGKCLNREPSKSMIQVHKPGGSPRMETKWDTIVSHAKNSYPPSGKLTVDERGFIYVKLPDQLVFDLFSLLNNRNTTIPPYFEENSYGAHISVVLASESRRAVHLNAIGKEIPFTITGCYSVEPENWPEMERVWFLTLDAPELSQIRTELGLDPKIMGHEFHITFALQKRFLSIDDILAVEGSQKFILGTGDVTKSRIRNLRNARNKA